jgi:hypothetical protein
MHFLRLLLCILFFLPTGCLTVRNSSSNFQLKKYVETVEIKNSDALKFPIRIGMARIQNGEIATIPPKELEAWEALRTELGSEIGEFVPVSRLITAMVNPPESRQNTVHSTLQSIRLGAARQHLDAVLIYDVYGEGTSKTTVFYILNLTIIGGFIFPGRSAKTFGYGSAVLMDVRSGDIYGTASSIAYNQKLMTSMSSYEKQIDLTEKTKEQAGVNLIDEVRKWFLKTKENKKTP